jgi:hypothetical protein
VKGCSLFPAVGPSTTGKPEPPWASRGHQEDTSRFGFGDGGGRLRCPSERTVSGYLAIRGKGRYAGIRPIGFPRVGRGSWPGGVSRRQAFSIAGKRPKVT